MQLRGAGLGVFGGLLCVGLGVLVWKQSNHEIGYLLGIGQEDSRLQLCDLAQRLHADTPVYTHHQPSLAKVKCNALISRDALWEAAPHIT